MGLGISRNGRNQPITPYKGSWAEFVDTPYKRHMRQQAKAKPSVPCSSHHVAIGGGCFNCLWNGK
jgi:hypothetical protein